MHSHRRKSHCWTSFCKLQAYSLIRSKIKNNHNIGVGYVRDDDNDDDDEDDNDDDNGNCKYDNRPILQHVFLFH